MPHTAPHSHTMRERTNVCVDRACGHADGIMRKMFHFQLRIHSHTHTHTCVRTRLVVRDITIGKYCTYLCVSNNMHTRVCVRMCVHTHKYTWNNCKLFPLVFGIERAKTRRGKNFHQAKFKFLRFSTQKPKKKSLKKCLTLHRLKRVTNCQFVIISYEQTNE